MGIEPGTYTKPLNVQFGTASDVYAQDYVLVLRYPDEQYLELMKPGGCLISMCHFPTRPGRRQYLRSRQLEAVSLDSIVDDNGQRLVENLRSVAWNGCEIAFHVLHEIWPNTGLRSPDRPPLRITLLGSGGVGMHAVQAAIRYGNPSLWQEYAENNVPGNLVRVVDYDFTKHNSEILSLLENTHLLIDATQRKNPSEIVIPNRFLEIMPEYSVILDLSVDPYDFQNKPYEVKGIEGIPQGNLDQYIFSPEDPAWDKLSHLVENTHRRWVVSCYSWPGIHPKQCMIRYGNQLSPLLRRLANPNGLAGIIPTGRFHDRALARAMLKSWG
jgi:alanine dehydrogenase